MVNDIVQTSALRNNLLSLKQSQRLVDQTTLNLATGRRVNTALDDPQNFFTAQSIQNRASDFTRLLDGINQSTRTIEEALIGLEAAEKLVNQAESIAIRSKELAEAGEPDPFLYEREIDVSPTPLNSVILANNPEVYYQLNETGGPIIDYGTAGGVTATYQGGASAGAAALYANGSQPSVNFDGVNDIIRVADSPIINTTAQARRTVELTFNADTVAGRQVLYEEGAGVNGLTIYIDNGLLYFTAEDDQGGNRYADININAPIVAGQTYHVGFVLDAPADSFTGYVDGVNVGTVQPLGGDALFPSHSGDIGIGGAPDGVQFHDGEAGGGFRFNGRISNVAIYNQTLTDADFARRANSLNSATTIETLNSDFDNAIGQLDQIAQDANYRGINLLENDNLLTNFNPDGSNNLITESVDFTYEGLGIEETGFDTIDGIDLILESVRDAKEQIRRFASSLVTDLTVIKTRETFTRELINNHLAGADELTVADLNREGANLLAGQTRLSLGTTALSLAADSQRSVLTLFGNSQAASA